jgi:predicted nucleic acid-binding protein
MRYAKKNEVTLWGNSELCIPIDGMMRKSPASDSAYQAQKDALFTVGRLIRESKIQAFTYDEIEYERFRARARSRYGNALRACIIQKCPPAIDRTKFRSGSFFDVIQKNGKKDRKKRKKSSELGQIPFFTWLKSLSDNEVKSIISNSSHINLTKFEIESFKKLDEFKLICDEANNPENFPDAFHLWTAHRNSLDAFLTLDKGLIKLSTRITQKSSIFHLAALQPLELLKKLKIETPDPVPLEFNRFYYWHEILQENFPY